MVPGSVAVDLDTGAASLRFEKGGEEVVKAMQGAVEGAGYEWKGYLYHQLGEGRDEEGDDQEEGEEEGEEEEEEPADSGGGAGLIMQLLGSGKQQQQQLSATTAAAAVPAAPLPPRPPPSSSAPAAAPAALDASGSVAAEVGLELRPAAPTPCCSTKASSSSCADATTSGGGGGSHSTQGRASRNRARHALRSAPGVVCACVMDEPQLLQAQQQQQQQRVPVVLVARVRVRGGEAATAELMAAVRRAGFVARPVPSAEAQARMRRIEEGGGGTATTAEGGSSALAASSAPAAVWGEGPGGQGRGALPLSPLGSSGSGGSGGGGRGGKGKEAGGGEGGAGAGHLGDSKAVYDVKGMTCGACVSAIETALRRAPGVVTAKVALLSERCEVLFDSQATDAEALRRRIEAVGYDAALLRALREDGRRSLAAAVFELQRPPLTAQEARLRQEQQQQQHAAEAVAVVVSSPHSPPSPATAFTGLREGLTATEGVVEVVLRDPPSEGDADDGGGAGAWAWGALLPGVFSSASRPPSRRQRRRRRRRRRQPSAASVVAWAVVRYEPELVGLRDIVKAMRAQGYAARLLPHASPDTTGGDGGNGGDGGHPPAVGSAMLGLSAKQARHLAEARRRLAACLWLAVPVTALAMAPPATPFLDCPPLSPGLRLRDVLLLALATLAQFGPGAVFYREAWKGLRGGSYGMALLVAMGTTAAWAFACFSLFRAWAMRGRVDPYSDFFMTSAMLLSFILLGKVRACVHTCIRSGKDKLALFR